VLHVTPWWCWRAQSLSIGTCTIASTCLSIDRRLYHRHKLPLLFETLQGSSRSKDIEFLDRAVCGKGCLHSLFIDEKRDVRNISSSGNNISFSCLRIIRVKHWWV